VKLDQQLGVNTHTPQLTPAQQMLIKQVEDLQAQAAQWESKNAALKAEAERVRKEKEEWDVYNQKMTQEKKLREEEETRKKYAADVAAEKQKWAVLEQKVLASKDATAIDEFYKVEKNYFDNLSLGKLSEETKYVMAVQECNASLQISGIQNQQQEMTKTNNEQLRILTEQHKAAQANLEKQKQMTEQLSNALNVAAANVPDPKAAFDIREFTKRIHMDNAPQQAPPMQAYQPPNQYGYQHQQPQQPQSQHLNQFQPSAEFQKGYFPYQQQKQYAAPGALYDPNAPMQDNVEANINSLFMTNAPHLNYEVAAQTASRVVETNPLFKQFKAVPEFAARNPEAYERILAGEGGYVAPLQFE